MDILQIITSIIGLLGGGALGSLFTLKYTRAKEKNLADQEGKTVDSMTIKNTDDLISIYRSALADIKELNRTHEEALNKRISEQDKKIKEQDQLIKDQKLLLEKMERNQLKLQLEVENLKKQSLDDCNICAFANSCAKRKAKLEMEYIYLHESTRIDEKKNVSVSSKTK